MLTDIVASSLPVFIDEFTRDEQPGTTQFLFLFVGTLCLIFFYTVKIDFNLELINNMTELVRRPAPIREGALQQIARNLELHFSC